MSPNPKGETTDLAPDAASEAAPAPASAPQSADPAPEPDPEVDASPLAELIEEPAESTHFTPAPEPSSRQWYSLERVKLAVLDAGGARLGMLTPGSMFGIYSVGSLIGEGGTARIYQAEHPGLRRQVALKVLIDGFARDPAGRERFLREARIAAAVKHPNVVNIFDVGVHEDIPYLVMELLEGQDLEKLLESRRALHEDLIVDIMVPVLAGLIAVHDAGIVHRDLKPANIFLARSRYYDLEPKLLDFGISKAPAHDRMKVTTHRRFLGTPLYGSPEGLRGEEMTQLSDQYSLGVVMYECATGQMPFVATTFAELTKLITAGRYTPPTSHKPELPKRLARIIERAMSLDPQNRFKDLREMGRELLLLAGQRTRITWGLSFGDAKATLLSNPGTPNSSGARAPIPPPPPKRHPAVLAALAAMQLVVPAAAVFIALSGRSLFHRGHRPPAVRASSVAAPVATMSAPAEAVQQAPPSSGDETEPERVNADALAAAGASARTDLAVHDLHEKTISVTDLPQARKVSRPVPTPVRRAPGSAPEPEPEPEWAIPAAPQPPPVKPNPDELRTGTNGAPILD